MEDLVFADDLALLSHNHQQMPEKTELLNTVSTQLGLNINRRKTRIMKANTKNNNPITLNGEPLEETDSFTYLGSTINKNGDTGKETRKKKRRRWGTPGEKWRRWPRTENGGVPWSMAYAPSEQTGISK